jgi:hypothetical protein
MQQPMKAGNDRYGFADQPDARLLHTERDLRVPALQARPQGG